MSAVVAILPTARAVEQAWEDYTRLARLHDDRPELRVDQAHQIEMVRAHRRFADLYCAWERETPQC